MLAPELSSLFVVPPQGMEDYYDSSFYFHAGIFQLPVSGVTHMCAGGGHASPPHPACPANGTAVPATSQWSGYRFHEKDPLWFEDGVQLIVRNGDVGGPVSYGTAKCCTAAPPCAPILLPEAAVSVSRQYLSFLAQTT